MAPQYLLYNLIVQSEIYIEETPALTGRHIPDVTVTLGQISQDPHLSEHTRYSDDKKWWHSMPDWSTFFFNCRAGIFEIRNGNKIIMQPKKKADMQLARLYLLGTAMGVLQMQRGTFPIHGGCLNIDGNGLIISGTQGAGKSTLTGAIVNQGYRFLADDVATMTVAGRNIQALPAYAQRKLCKDACIHQGYDPDQLIVISEEREKYAIRCMQEWHDSPLALQWLIEVIPLKNIDAPRWELVIGKDKLHTLLRSLYRPWVYQIHGVDPHRMKKLLTAASELQIYRVFRPSGISASDATTEMILSLLHR